MELEQLEKILKEKYLNCVIVPQHLKNKGKEPVYKIKNLTISQLWNMYEIYKEDIKNGLYNAAILIRGDLIVVDFDNFNYEDDVQKIPDFNTIKVQTEKGYHYYFLRTPECDINKVYNYSYKTHNVDIITKRAVGKEGGLIQIPPSKNKKWIKSFLNTKIMPFNMEVFKWLDDSEQMNRLKRIQIEEDDYNNPQEYDNNKITIQLLTKIVMNLNDDKYKQGTYENWIRVIFSIKNLGIRFKNIGKLQAKNLCYDFSKQDPSAYSRQKIDDIFRDETPCNNKVGLRTLLNFLKDDNIDIYYDIIEELNKPNINGFQIKDIEEGTNLTIEDIKKDGIKRDYENLKFIFEKTNAKILGKKVAFIEHLNHKYIIRTKAELIDNRQNIQFYENENEKPKSLVSKWLNDPNIREFYSYDNLPPPLKVPDGCFNIWNGFRAQKLKCTPASFDDLTFLLDFINILCNRDDDTFNHLINTMAKILQKPAERSNTALILTSKKHGAGKSLFIKFFGHKILGPDLFYTTRDPLNDLFNKHSNAFDSYLLTFIDEPDSKVFKSHFETFKNLITEETQRIERKGIDATQVKSYTTFFIATNSENILTIEPNDRRLGIIEVNSELAGEENAGYFIDLINKLEDQKIQKAFYEYLMNINLDGYDFRKTRPRNKLYNDYVEKSLSPIILFMASLVQQVQYYNNNESVDLGGGLGLFNQFKKYLTYTNNKSDLNITNFGTKIKSFDGVSCNLVNGKTRYSINTKKLKKHLEDVEGFKFNTFQIIDLDELNLLN